MANKNFTLDSGLAVTVYKRRASRNLRLSIDAGGRVRVSIPSWLPYKAGVDFAVSKQDWLRSQQKQPKLLTHGQAVGKAHHLVFLAEAAAAKPTSRVHSSLVTVTHPPHLAPASSEVQAVAREASVRALRAQSEQLLPQRLAALANKHGINYGQVSVKRLKSRWGSCDQNGNIVLNLFLMQLPWELIDYVLLHELTHTAVLKHGPDFWQAMTAVSPTVKQQRKALRQYQPYMNSVP